MWRHVGLISVLIFYVFMGGAIFHSIEHPVEVILEQRLANETTERRQAFVLTMIELQGQCTAENRSNCEELIERSLRDYEEHIQRVKEDVPKEEWRRWGFWSSVFYSGALITTIGEFILVRP